MPPPELRNPASTWLSTQCADVESTKLRDRDSLMQWANLLGAGESAWWGNIRTFGCRHTWCSVAAATCLSTVVAHEWQSALAPACLPGGGGQESPQQQFDAI